MRETRPVAAALSVLLAMSIIGLIDNFIVVIAERHGLWQFQVMRTALALPMIGIVVALGLGTVRPKSWRALSARSFFISTAMVIYFGSLAFRPIAEVAAGLFTSPIWVLIISVVFLGQRVGPIRIAAALVGFLGVMLVLRPDTGALSPYAFLPVVAGIFYAVASMMTRQWCAEESGLAVLAFNFLALGLVGVAGVLALTIFPQVAPAGPEGFLARVWAPLDAEFLFWTTVQAVGSLVGVWFLIRGYQLADTSFVAMFEFSLLIFVSIWAYLLRSEVLDVWGVAGITLIIGAGAVIVLRGR